jgi:hypothetical protein
MTKRNRHTPPRSPNPKLHKHKKSNPYSPQKAHGQEIRKNGQVSPEKHSPESTEVRAATSDAEDRTAGQVLRCTEKPCIGSKTAAVSPCATFQCKNHIHPVCGTLYNHNVYCSSCAERHDEHEWLTTPKATYEKDFDAKPRHDHLRKILFLTRCWVNDAPQLPFPPYKVLQYHRWWHQHGISFASTIPMELEELTVTDVTTSINQVYKHFYPTADIVEQETLINVKEPPSLVRTNEAKKNHMSIGTSQINTPMPEHNNSAEHNTLISPPSITRNNPYAKSSADARSDAQSDASLSPFQARVDLNNMGFQGRIRSLAAIRVALKNKVFHTVSDTTILQALYNMSDLSLDMTPIDNDIKQQLMNMSTARLLHEESNPNPPDSLLSLLLQLSGIQPTPEVPKMSLVQRKELFDRCMHTFKNRSVPVSDISNNTMETFKSIYWCISSLRNIYTSAYGTFANESP